MHTSSAPTGDSGTLKTASILLGLIALVGSVTCLSGWVFDLPRLTDWLNDDISIQPNTAVLIGLAGAAVVLLQTGYNRVLVVLGGLVALGGVLNAGSIPHIRAPIVCGSANNQLATPEDGERLRQRGILYAPDYVVNAGGIISAVAEYEGNVPELVVDERIAAIHDRTLQILERARAEDSATSAVADQMAREIIARARQA